MDGSLYDRFGIWVAVLITALDISMSIQVNIPPNTASFRQM
jgi:hypothetical protein